MGHIPNLELLARELLATKPDIVLTDVRDSGSTDAAAVAAIVAATLPSAKVLVVTSDANDVHAVEAIEAGVSGYLLQRSITAEVLATMIIAVATSGVAVLTTSLLQNVQRSLMDNANQRLARSGTLVAELTMRELEVLRALAEGSSNAAIAAHLTLSRDTVRKHVTRISSKLGVSTRTEAALHGARAGLAESRAPHTIPVAKRTTP